MAAARTRRPGPWPHDDVRPMTNEHRRRFLGRLGRYVDSTYRVTRDDPAELLHFRALHGDHRARSLELARQLEAMALAEGGLEAADERLVDDLWRRAYRPRDEGRRAERESAAKEARMWVMSLLEDLSDRAPLTADAICYAFSPAAPDECPSRAVACATEALAQWRERSTRAHGRRSKWGLVAELCEELGVRATAEQLRQEWRRRQK